MASQCAEERPRRSAPIESARLAQNTAGNRKLERELLALFRTQTGAYLAALESATDDERWIAAAHTLKGAAQAVGAMRIADLAEEAERLTGARARERTALLEGIRQAVDEARRFIDYQLLDCAH